jgi:predicted ester cyclase
VGKNTKTAAVARPDSAARANQQLVRRFIEEFWNGRKLDLADEIIFSDCQTHQLRSGAPLTGVPRGPDAIKHHVAGWLRGFPDLRFTIEQIFSSGDKVFTQSVMEGTPTGTWLEIPATNKRAAIRMMTVHRIERGKIAED